jgi:putative transcriptional regulator
LAVRVTGVVLVALLGTALLRTDCALWAAGVDPEVRRLQPGVFLYASPQLRDPNFSQTVVLLVEYGSKGAMGLVIDRPTEVLASELLKDAKALRGLQVYWGGPVQPEAVFGLVTTGQPSKEAVRVIDGLYLTGKQQDLEAAARGGKAEERVRIYLGYAGWGAGQLEGEVMRDGWLVTPGDPAAVFSPEPEKVWRRAYQLLDRLEALDLSGRGVVARLLFREPRP